MDRDPRARLGQLLRPAGGGIHTVSTGRAAQLALQERIYDARGAEAVRARWQAALDRAADARLVILGVPSDVGAGFVRGASFGPQAIRSALLARGSWLYRDARVVDLGDVPVVPQLLHDEMLSESQRARSRVALYGEDDGASPVGPLSIAETVLEAVRALAPQARPLLLGGDHSVGWPGLAGVSAGRERQTGILHFDAHTDLLSERVGVRYCFATWAWHANERVGRGGRLQQVGIRASGHDRAHWESSCEVRQYWMDEMRTRPAEAVAEEIVAAFRAAGVEGVYVSNDIDGTDPQHGAATGTPEPGGLEPHVVERLITRVAAAFPIWGSDLVEVAPTVAAGEGEPARTLATAARYVELQARLSLG